MATKRIKVAVGPLIKTREEMEGVVRSINVLTQVRDGLTVEMDGKITAVRKQYEAQLSEAQTNLDRLMGHAREWAENNKEAFGKLKSLEMVHGIIGFRTGTPKLKTLAKMTWEKVLKRLSDLGNFYVRTVPEVDKESILADREKLGKDQLAKMGVRVAQDETFYVEPKREPMESARIAV